MLYGFLHISEEMAKKLQKKLFKKKLLIYFKGEKKKHTFFRKTSYLFQKKVTGGKKIPCFINFTSYHLYKPHKSSLLF